MNILLFFILVGLGDLTDATGTVLDYFASACYVSGYWFGFLAIRDILNLITEVL